MHATFEDRREAGRRLAKALAERGYQVKKGPPAGAVVAPRRGFDQGDGLLVLGIPRGGVPVADEVARALRAPLDVVISRKLRAPYQPELAIGAVTSGNHICILNEAVAEAAGATREYLEREIRHQQEEIDRRLRAFRGDRPPPELKGRTVLVVDDGIATGYTFRAALEGLRKLGPRVLVAAVPVGPAESVAALRALADDVVCLETPEPFWAVGAWYDDFTQTTDEDVVAILQENWSRTEPALPATAPEPESSPTPVGAR